MARYFATTRPGIRVFAVRDTHAYTHVFLVLNPNPLCKLSEPRELETQQQQTAGARSRGVKPHMT